MAPASSQRRAPAGYYPKGVQWDAPIAPANLIGILDKTVKDYGDRPALSFMGYEMDYTDFGSRVEDVAFGLIDMGVQPGDRIGLYMPNTPYYPIMFFAALKAGATVVNFSSLYVEHELEKQIEDSGTKIMVTMDLKQFYANTKSLLDKKALEKMVVCPMSGTLPFVKSLAFRLLKSKEVARPDKRNPGVVMFDTLWSRGADIPGWLPEPNPEDTAVLQYTGGSTGTPKGAVLSHFNIAANAAQIGMMFGRRGNRPAAPALMRPGQEKFLVTIPFFHIFGLTIGLINAVKNGAEIAILPNPRDIAATLQAIDKQKPTIFPAVPRILQAMTESKDIGNYDLHSVRAVISGGAPLPSNVHDAFVKATGCGIYQGYGLSETSPVVASNPPTGQNKPESVGVPFPQTEIRIASLSAPETEAPHGEDGEICVKGPQVMSGYWNRPEETAQVLKDGWFHTGDIGHFDDDGYLHITDRLKRMLAINGFKVYPNMVENAICQHPAVAECVVVGVNKGTVNESVKAFIRYKDGAKAPGDSEMRAFLKDRLNRLEIPRFIEVRTEELPKTSVGKPDWKKLEDEEAAKSKASVKPSAPKPDQI